MRKWLSLAILVVVIIAAMPLIFHVASAKPAPPVIQEPTSANSLSTYDLWVLTNNQRAAAGIPPLVLDAQLDSSATGKCSDMANKHYFAHDAPDGSKPWVFIEHAIGHVPKYEGENLAQDYKTSDAVLSAWMASPEHKKNILDASYTNVGYAICNADAAGTYKFIVQHFTGQ